MKQLNTKTPLVFRIGLFLAFALILSFHLTGGLYARYTTSASGEDGARVAIFRFGDNLSEQSQLLPSSFAPGESLDTQISIRNDGEVTIRYVVKIQNLTKNLPIEDRIIQSSVVACNTESTFSWKIEWPETANSVEYMGKVDVLRLVVTVEQID